MIRKNKSPLMMADGTNVSSSLDELRAHFDIESIINYFHSGQLTQWLEDRYYEEEAEKMKSLDKNSSDLKQQLCSILGVSPSRYAVTDAVQLKRISEKERLLYNRTTDKEIIKLAPQTAFNQEDLADLLDIGESVIYLCGSSFSIPIRMNNIKYIGLLSTPQIKIKANSAQEVAEKQITFENVILPWSTSSLSTPTMSIHTTSSTPQIDKTIITSAQKLLDAIKDPKLRSWANCNVWFVYDFPSTCNKSAFEKSIRDGAREVERELPNEISDCIGLIIGKLKKFQAQYDELFIKSNLPTKLLNPDLNTISYQIKIAGDEAKRYKPFDLASEIVSAARYDAMESPDFTGIFGGKDYMLANDSELDSISNSYCKKVAQKLGNSNGAKAVNNYLNAMAANLQAVFLNQKK